MTYKEKTQLVNSLLKRLEELNKQRDSFREESAYLNRLKNRSSVLENLVSSPFNHQQGVQTIMNAKDSFMGILGVVSLVLKPHDSYEQAISSAIAGAMYHIVCEDEMSARHAITYLKKNQSGRATFLPLSVCRERVLNKEHQIICENMNGYLGVASEFVDCDPIYQILNSYLLGGSTYFAEDYTSVSMDPQIRYYTGIDAVSHIRLTLWYGMATYKPSIATIEEQIASSFGLEFRIHFLKSTVGNVVVDPFFRFTYKTAIDGNNTDVTAGYVGSFVDKGLKDYDKPYLVMFEIPVGLNASSDIVTLYLEPRLGYSFSGKAGAKGDAHDPSINHSLVWGAYGEIYITPVKDLEWYFEADVGSYTSTTVDQNLGVLPGYVDNAVNFAASTGITWYLPSFNGAE